MHPSFQLGYITDRRSLHGTSLESFLCETIRAGVDLIQIREKDLSTRELISLTEQAVSCASGSASRIVVNDRLDVALSVGAAGVHLGHHSMPTRAVRAIVPQGFLIGVSCHSLEDAVAAESEGADYILFGPVFETPSKLPYGPPLGLQKLQEVTARVKAPVLALGGITLERVKPCLEAGARGIAGIRIFQDASSLPELITELRAHFELAQRS
jgi:thiamine-phosphate pyrophosphorylase